MLLSEKHNEKRNAFQRCAFHCAFQQNFMSFGAITKYRSFVIYERPTIGTIIAAIEAINRGFSKPLCPRFGKNFPKTVCDGINNL